jgi:4-hydroxythreonine-4-phosphate dehydrogenase
MSIKDKPRKKLRIGITIGDINGIGPELIIKAFAEPPLRELFTPIIYGSSRVLNTYRKLLSTDKFSYNVIQTPDQAQPKRVSVIECIPGVEEVEVGKPSAAGGLAAYQALKAATEHLKSGEIDALVTLPIDKSTIRSKEFDFPGHTEFLGKTFNRDTSLMLMISDHLKVATVTGHVPLSRVSDLLNVELIYRKIAVLNESLKVDFNIVRPRIAVLGVNPHAGDNGLLGKEDQEKIVPAVQKADKEGIWVFGPYSADGFFGSGQWQKFDAVLAMYHDQGLIPFKLLAGFEGVNYTAGLPAIRTSPDHGVAYTLAGKDIATPDSFIQAIYAAIDIHRNRSDYEEVRSGALKPTAKVAHKPYNEAEEEVVSGEGN